MPQAASQSRTGSASHSSLGATRRAGLTPRTTSEQAALPTDGTGATPGGGSRSDGQETPQAQRRGVRVVGPFQRLLPLPPRGATSGGHGGACARTHAAGASVPTPHVFPGFIGK